MQESYSSEVIDNIAFYVHLNNSVSARVCVCVCVRNLNAVCTYGHLFGTYVHTHVLQR